MPDLGNAFTQWLLSQLDSLPTNLLREGAEFLTVDRVLAHVFEQRETANVRALLRPPQGQEARVATILLPGILGSLLASTRGLSALLWFNPMIIMDGHLNLLDLAPDGRSDRSPDVEITPVGIEKMTYLQLIRALASHSRLYQFPYDWRRHIEGNADQLHASIQRWNTAEPGRRYAIVCHSMGGLVARAYLARHPQEAERLIERVIMIGTPFHGAPATALTFTDEQNPAQLVARLNEQNDMTGFTANLPSLYQLLPAPPELFRPQRDYPFDWDIYDASAWGLPWIRQDYLDDARALHAALAASDPQVEMVNIVGCHQRTIRDVRRDDGQQGCPLVAVYQDSGPESGDEQVPLWSAQDKRLQVYYVQDTHGRLVSNDQVLQAVVNLLYGQPVELPAELPEPGHPLRSLRASPLMQQVAEIKEHIEQGRLSRKDIERLFFDR
jgi:pimeloyl-ACP methyl ester carboxylesterase